MRIVMQPMSGGDSEDESGPESGPAEKKKQPPPAKKLMGVLRSLPMYRTPGGRVFVDLDGLALPIDTKGFYQFAARTYHDRYDDVVSKSVIDNVALALSGRELQKRDALIRVAGDASQIVLDLGDEQGRAVIVTADQVRVEPMPVSFYRPAGSLPLPLPPTPMSDADSAGVLSELRAVLGIDDHHVWTCILAWLLSSVRPVGPYTILICRGEQGSGKSTLAKMLRSLIDPRRPEIKAPPNDTRNLAIGADHAHVLVFDNISTIDATMSDALCRLATGDAFETRSLYTDRELSVFEASRPMILTSIADAATRPDLLDRGLLVRLPRRRDRLDDHELVARLDQIRDRVLGALLYCAHRAIGAVDQVQVPADIRMRAPARFAVAAEPALGLASGAIVAAYQTSRSAATEVAASDPVVAALLEWLVPGVGGVSWEGLLSDLYKHLGKTFDRRPPRGWPENERGFRAQLDRLLPTLAELGVRVDLSRLDPVTRRRMIAIDRGPVTDEDV